MRSSATAVHRHEVAAVAVAFAYFFCLLSGYYLLRPIRDEMGILAGTGRLGELFGWTFLSMLLLVPAWSAVVSRAPRRLVIPIAYQLFSLMLVGFALAWAAGGARPVVARVFFVWLSVYNVFVVSVFWSLMVDLFQAEQARRLFGLVAAGGSCGALAGPVVASLSAQRVGIVPLLIVAALLLQVCVGCVGWLVRWARRHGTGDLARGADTRVGGGLLAGFAAIVRSPFLAGIAALITLYALASTVLYTEQARLVPLSIPDSGERVAFFSRIDLTINATTLAIELLGTGWVMTRLGLATALLALPAITATGLVAFGLYPTLAVLVVVGVSRRIAHFALEKPAREALFTVVPAEEKYKAKSCLDTVVYRGTDWVAAAGHQALVAAGLAGPAVVLGLAPVAALGLPLAVLMARRHASLETEGVRS